MAHRTKPTCTTKCPANRFTDSDTTIAEFSFPGARNSAGQPKGGLIEFFVASDGTPVASLYRLDGEVRVQAPGLPELREVAEAAQNVLSDMDGGMPLNTVRLRRALEQLAKVGMP